MGTVTLFPGLQLKLALAQALAQARQALTPMYQVVLCPGLRLKLALVQARQPTLMELLATLCRVLRLSQALVQLVELLVILCQGPRLYRPPWRQARRPRLRRARSLQPREHQVQQAVSKVVRVA